VPLGHLVPCHEVISPRQCRDAAFSHAGKSMRNCNRKKGRSNMKIRQCPRCHQHMLISTGAFWTCYACSFAITGQALSVDLGYHPETTGDSKRRRPR
jgi:hypothetical protein